MDFTDFAQSCIIGNLQIVTLPNLKKDGNIPDWAIFIEIVEENSTVLLSWIFCSEMQYGISMYVIEID